MNTILPNKSVLRIALYLSLVLGGLTIIAGASAQPAMTNNPPLQQSSNAPALPVPASNLLVLSMATGKVRALDSKGLLMESNMVYLPRIKISTLSDPDLLSLLETKKAYAALTSFGPANQRTAQSPVIENQLRQIWLNGNSLSDKIQTRLELLDDMRAYNDNLANLPGLVQGASAADIRADVVNDRTAIKNQVAASAADGLENAQEARAYGDASRHQLHDAWWEYETANERAAKADNRAAAANYQSSVANQSLQNYLDACAAISTNLAAYGINVPASPPFCPIPPLSMKAEVDAERSANISSTTGQ